MTERNPILEEGNNVEITGLDESGGFLGVLYAHIDRLQKSRETVVIHCTDVWGRKHAVVVQESDDGKLSNLVQVWGLNTKVPAVHGPVAGARVNTRNRKVK